MIFYYVMILKLTLKKYLMLTVAYLLSFRHKHIREQISNQRICVGKVIQLKGETPAEGRHGAKSDNQRSMQIKSNHLRTNGSIGCSGSGGYASLPHFTRSWAPTLKSWKGIHISSLSLPQKTEKTPPKEPCAS